MNPEPKTVEVCTSCGERWRPHLRLARSRAIDDFREVAERDGYDASVHLLSEWPGFDAAESSAEVTHLDCVWVLKSAMAGPPGPVGPMGATGKPGPPTTCAHAT